ncbi:MAG: branched-chain amino acid ABC transporter permease [Pseudomonadota bacterium]
MTLEALFYILVSAAVLGSLYAIMAIGLALVWTTLGIFNFAHGAFIGLGAYLAWSLADPSQLGLGLLAGIALALPILVLVGIASERVAVRPFLGRDNLVLVTVITTLAVASIIENAILLTWGSRAKQLEPLVEGTVSAWGIGVSAHEVAVILIVPFILAAVWAFLQKTRTGTALRAVAQNQNAARLMSIPVTRIFALSFALATVLAGLAGIFLGAVKFMSPSMGADPLVKALIVVIFGGIGSLSGPIRAAYIVGLMEAVLTFSVGIYWTQASLFLVMIAVLMVRPTGLFGKRG